MRSISLTITAAFLLAAAPVMRAQQEGPVPTTTIVHIEAKGRPVDPSMLTLQLRGKPVAIDSLTPATGQGVELAILIDDGLRTSFALQLKDLDNFIQGLPPSVKVLVGYMRDGSVSAKTGFTNDHEVLSKQIRIPFSAPGISASPYLCLSDFVKQWPSRTRAARVVLMITNGVDPYNGSTSVLNQDSPYVQQATDDAIRAGAAIYALYYGNTGMRGGSANFSGQSYLSQIADATGGESLWQGTSNPVNVSPYLKELGKALNETYLLAFQAPIGNDRHHDLVPMKVKSNVSGVKVHGPNAVQPGVDE